MSTIERSGAPAAATLLSALRAGDLDAAVAAVPDGALTALPGVGSETAPRLIATDSAGLRAGLEATFADRTAEVLLQLTSGSSDVLVEGRLLARDGAATGTWLASLQVVAGAVARLLVYVCPLVEPARTWGVTSSSTGDARELVDRYFEHLDRGEFEAAVACFSRDALYSHPPYQPGGPRAEFRGHAELLAGFQRRGVKPDRSHRIDVSVQDGADYMLEGCTTDRAGSRTFMSSVSLDSSGLIQRYLAVACASMVPRVGPAT